MDKPDFLKPLILRDTFYHFDPILETAREITFYMASALPPSLRKGLEYFGKISKMPPSLRKGLKYFGKNSKGDLENIQELRGG